MNRELSFSIRPATMEDAQTVTDLIIRCDIAEFGVPDFELSYLLDIWADIPIETNTWLVYTPEQVIGYGFIEELSMGRLDCYGYVDPSYKGFGVGQQLLNHFEKRAQDYILEYKKMGIQYWLNNVIPANSDSAKSLLELNNYTFQRTHSRMVIELVNEPLLPSLHEQLVILPYDAERDAYAVYEVYNEAFADTREYVEYTFEEWQEKKSGAEYDQRLWFVAYLNQKLVGFTISKVIPEGTYIDLLGVKREARKNGIGFNLLLTTFQASYKIGLKNISLTVDSHSLTQANRLYETAGMKPVFQVSVYTKQLHI